MFGEPSETKKVKPKEAFHWVTCSLIDLALASINARIRTTQAGSCASVRVLLMQLYESEMTVQAAHQAADSLSGLPDTLKKAGEGALASRATEVLADLRGRKPEPSERPQSSQRLIGPDEKPRHVPSSQFLRSAPSSRRSDQKK